MRFYVGVFSLMGSLGLILFSILFFDYTDLFEKLFSALLYFIAALMMLFSIRNLTTFYGYKRILVKGLHTKAKVISVKSTILAIKDAPKLILEVMYEHPKNKERYKAFVDYYGDKKFKKFNVKQNEFIDVLIDPNDPTVALLDKT